MKKSSKKEQLSLKRIIIDNKWKQEDIQNFFSANAATHSLINNHLIVHAFLLTGIMQLIDKKYPATVIIVSCTIGLIISWLSIKTYKYNQKIKDFWKSKISPTFDKEIEKPDLWFKGLIENSQRTILWIICIIYFLAILWQLLANCTACTIYKYLC